MTIVAHKYTPGEVSPAELEATFAARGHTVDFFLKSLRDQISSGTLSSFVIVGPRGAGKSTVIRMVVLRITQDTALNNAWLPVVFPEEQFEVTSLRDLFAAALRILSAQKIPDAADWLQKTEATADDEQSLQFGITGLRSISRAQNKRLILFIENLNLLLEESISDQDKGTLRRLLMTDPFMLVVASTVHVFDSLRNYDEAFFNYLAPVRLQRLDADQVFELLRLRAEYDGNKVFLAAFAQFRPRIRAMVQLSGGNPRLVLMLYELLSQQRVAGIVDQLRQLVDELTPLLKDEVENLAPQQRKIIHALMEKGGTAQPAELVPLTRLPLSTVTSQLRRLKEAQFIELFGGGKGRRASYTVPDQLFKIWYEMRYLRKNRRRIEMFVEVLRVWFESEERMSALRTLCTAFCEPAPKLLRDRAWTAEYFAASLVGTPFEAQAHDIALHQWVRSNGYQEAAEAHAASGGTKREQPDKTRLMLDLSRWFGAHDDPQAALETANQVLESEESEMGTKAEALVLRGVAKGQSGDVPGAIADLSTIVGLPGAPSEDVAWAFLFRAMLNDETNEPADAIVDYSAVVELHHAPPEPIAIALLNRGFAKRKSGDAASAIADFSAVLDLHGAPPEVIARAFFNRGIAKGLTKDSAGAIADFSRGIAHASPSDSERVAGACVLSARLVGKGKEHELERVLLPLTQWIRKQPEPAARQHLVSFLSQLASPELRAAWLWSWRFLAPLQKPETMEALVPFKSVAAVLSGAGGSVLEPLPPEQREFAETVLARFEPESDQAPS